jgi:WD40 repeat protein
VIRALKGDYLYVTGAPRSSIAISHNGAFAITASHNPIMWDLQGGNEIARLRGTSFPVTAVALSPDGSLVAVANEDGAVTLWPINGTGRLQLLQLPITISTVLFANNNSLFAGSSRPADDDQYYTVEWSFDKNDLLHSWAVASPTEYISPGSKAQEYFAIGAYGGEADILQENASNPQPANHLVWQ